MDIHIQTQEKETIVEFIGRLDTTASVEIAPRIESLNEVAGGTIVMDCSQLSFISSAGLRIFMNLRKASAEKGGRIILKGLNDEISDVFMMVGFLNLFEIQ